jgi:hypothetical protein
LLDGLSGCVNHWAARFPQFVEMRKKDELLLRAGIRPMDLKLLLERMGTSWYQSVDEFVNDVKLLTQNAVTLGMDKKQAKLIVEGISKTMCDIMKAFQMKGGVIPGKVK